MISYGEEIVTDNEAGKQARVDTYEFGDTFVQDIWNRWIAPEIERRRNAGKLPADCRVDAAQLIQTYRHARAPLTWFVRLNREVKAKVAGYVFRPLADGEQPALEDLDGITGIELTAHDPNAGHFTMIHHRETWHIAFDFRHDSARVKTRLALARGFLKVATLARGMEPIGPCFDNLHSATELMAQALLQMHDTRVVVERDHELRREALRKWAELGNVDARYADLLVRLADLRGPARYGVEVPLPDAEEARAMLEIAEEMFADASARVPDAPAA